MNFKVGDRVRFTQAELAKRGESFGHMVGTVVNAAAHPAGGQMLWVQFDFTGEGFLTKDSDCPLELA